MKTSRATLTRNLNLATASLAFVALFSGCGFFMGSGSGSSPTPGATTPGGTAVAIYPPSITMTAKSGATYTFTGSSGSTPYTYSIASGSGSINSTTGVYTAGTLTGTTTVNVTDAAGSVASATVNQVSIVTNGTLSTVTVDASGNQFIGGLFSAVYPFSAPWGIAVSLTDGSPVLGFDLKSGFNAPVTASALLPDGSLIVGGSFTTYRGLAASHIAKINATGVLDTTFDAGGAGFDGNVLTITNIGTSVYVGGSFANYRGSSANGIAKLDSTTGTLDTVFNAGGTGFTGSVAALATSGTSVYAVGGFTVYRGTSVARIIKLDSTTGVRDAAFNAAGTGPDVYTSAVVASGSALYIGGSFANYAGSSANRIAKVNLATGALDTSFNTGGTGFDTAVNALAFSGTSLYVGGTFSTYRGSAANKIAKLDGTTGLLDGTFDAGGAGFTGGSVTALAISGTSVVAAGSFTTYRSVTTNGLAKLDTTAGLSDTTFSPPGGAGVSGVSTITVMGSYAFLGGSFASYRGAAVTNIAKLAATSGAVDMTFGLSGTGFDATVQAFAINGTSLYVGGSFQNYRGSTAGYIAKLDASTGVLDTTFNPGGAGFDFSVFSLVVNGTSVYAGGAFSNYRGSAASHIAKLDLTTGALAGTFDSGGAGFDGAVDVLFASGTNLFVGGGFTHYRGSTANSIAKLTLSTGVLDGTFNPSGTGFDNEVFSLAVSGTSLYAGGWYSNYRGSAAGGIAKLDLTTGALDGAFNTGGAGFSLGPYALVVSGTSIFAGGGFTTYRGSAAVGIIKLDLATGLQDATFNPGGVGYNNSVTALATFGTNLFSAGSFTTYQGSGARSYNVIDTTTGSSL